MVGVVLYRGEKFNGASELTGGWPEHGHERVQFTDGGRHCRGKVALTHSGKLA